MAQRPTSRAAGKVKRTPKAAPGATTKKAATAKAAKTKASAAKEAPKVAATKSSAAKPVTPKTKAARSPSKAPKTAAAKTAPAKIAAAKTTPAKTKPATPARKAAATKAAAPRKASKPTPRPAKTARQPPYLAAELGQPTDQKGEPVGAGQALVRSDAPLQDYTLQLWRQMQSGRVVHRYMRTIERAGLTVDEVWTAGLSDIRATSSTPDEMQRYRQKVLFRANLLEAILSETVADLRRLDGIEPTPAKTTSLETATPEPAPEPG